MVDVDKHSFHYSHKQRFQKIEAKKSSKAARVVFPSKISRTWASNYFENLKLLQLSSFYIAIVLTVKHQIQITNPKLDALFVYKIEFQKLFVPKIKKLSTFSF